MKPFGTYLHYRSILHSVTYLSSFEIYKLFILQDQYLIDFLRDM